MLLLNMYSMLELSGLFVYLGDLLSFSVPGGTEKVVGLWFAREGISTQADTMVRRLLSKVKNKLIYCVYM